MRYIAHKILNRSLIMIFLLGTVSITGCGIKGDLQTPPPLWGDKDKTKTEKPADEDSILNDSPLDDDQDDIFVDDPEETEPF